MKLAPAHAIEAESTSEFDDPPDPDICGGPGAPVVALLPGGRMLIDGNPIESEAELRTVLENKQRLRAEIGVPPERQLVIQSFRGVEPGRLKRIKAVGNSTGYMELNLMEAAKAAAPRPSAKSN